MLNNVVGELVRGQLGAVAGDSCHKLLQQGDSLLVALCLRVLGELLDGRLNNTATVLVLAHGNQILVVCKEINHEVPCGDGQSLDNLLNNMVSVLIDAEANKVGVTELCSQAGGEMDFQLLKNKD